jgi:AcrR family transcriptional regulator
MADIAGDAGVAKAVMFRTAVSKQRLIDSTLARAATGMRIALTCSPQPIVILERALAFARTEKDLFLLLFETARGHPKYGGRYAEMAALTSERLLNIPYGVETAAATPHQIRTAAAMTALLHEGLTNQIVTAAPREDDQFLAWADAMLAAWAKAAN